ncbi:conjugal transfer protein TraB [Embleya sp. NPDC059237]|uniref:conjugal transfer protein TraB n=1 Tax=Embleya sp. NPDC059237 TaxID=3346784 RepID=UPI00369093DD
MGDLVPVNTGEMVSADGASFPAIQRQLADLAHVAGLLEEALGRLTRRMQHNADLSRVMGEQAAAAEVDSTEIAQMEEVTTALSGVATVSAAVARRADGIRTAALATQAAHDAEYRGVYEAVQAVGTQAKAGFYRNT